MNKTLRWALIIVGIVVVAAALVWGGVLAGRATVGWTGFGSGYNMMGGYYSGPSGSVQSNYAFGPGMMNGGMIGGGMMGYTQNYSGTLPYGPGMTNGGMMGSGMMGGMMNGGMMGNGMMGGFGSNSLAGIKPLSLDQARRTIEDYVAGLNNPDLTIGEVMVFDNHAYAQIVEKSTGIGAQEVLVDPVTLAVYPEYGPNMMWNQKYSPMGGFGNMMMGGGMMGGVQTSQTPNQMPVSAEEVIQAAQRYLETYLPGAKADSEAAPFYGYYTLDTLRVRDGKPVGMLSVNGYTRQVFVHTWHGNFLEEGGE